MFLHVAIVFALTALLSGNIFLSAIITVLHWLIDGSKIEALKRKLLSALALFIIDQLLHILAVVVCWSAALHLWQPVLKAATVPFTNYHYSLVLLGYLLVTTPVGYLIMHAIKNINAGSGTNIQHGGTLIGIFERVIILTFVLLGQYEAIGFLITGKSIIRFASQHEDIRSEYVLVGTMMSYAMAILTGVAINYLLAL